MCILFIPSYLSGQRLKLSNSVGNILSRETNVFDIFVLCVLDILCLNNMLLNFIEFVDAVVIPRYWQAFKSPKTVN